MGKFIGDMQFYIIFMNYLNRMYCDCVKDSLCGPYVLAAMCMENHVILCGYDVISLIYDNVILYAYEYIYIYIMCSLTP